MTKEDLIKAHNRIRPYIHNTPVLTSRSVDEMIGAHLFFKCENFQKMGAFKMRGAAHAILQLSRNKKKNGVVTHSSGNFAQALALAAEGIGVKAFIVMPSNAPRVKKDAVRGYGGQIIECEPTLEAREKTANEIVRKVGATFIHPSNDIDVILGQATACKELLETHKELNSIIVPVGGGGLIAGTALAVQYFGKDCKIIGGEPFEADDAYRSLQSGLIQFNKTTHTIADGLRTHLGDRNFPIIQKYVDRIIRVEEEEIKAAMKLIWERLKIVVEPSSAVTLAAVFKEKETFQRGNIGVILSGGNVDFSS